jgi:hypothetical protein
LGIRWQEKVRDITCSGLCGSGWGPSIEDLEDDGSSRATESYENHIPASRESGDEGLEDEDDISEDDVSDMGDSDIDHDM